MAKNDRSNVLSFIFLGGAILFAMWAVLRVALVA